MLSQVLGKVIQSERDLLKRYYVTMIAQHFLNVLSQSCQSRNIVLCFVPRNV